MNRELEYFCSINMGQSPDSKSYNTINKGIPFYQGNADFGVIHPKTRIWCDVPIKIADKNDILISVRAPIGALNIADEMCCIGRGLASITPYSDKCELMYLYYALQSKVSELNSKGTGSTFKAVSKKTLLELEIPQLSISEQRKVISTLGKLDDIIEKNKKIVDLFNSLIKSRFVEMFGDPISNSFDLPEVILLELGELGRGVSKHRPRNDPKLLGGEYPLIQTGNVAAADLYITTYENTYSELGLQQSKMWDKGTLCITIAANIAKTAILGFNACFPDSIVGFNANEKISNVFIHYWFSFFQEILESQAPESAQKNINLKILSELKVIVPSKAKQNDFENFVHQVNKSKFEVQKSLEKLEILKKSLMQKYFG